MIYFTIDTYFALKMIDANGFWMYKLIRNKVN